MKIEQMIDTYPQLVSIFNSMKQPEINNVQPAKLHITTIGLLVFSKHAVKILGYEMDWRRVT